ncbi:DsbA family protein [Actinacidiphila acididurans]|uniref:Thioredoxin domain-containing protein n=1 Tax=Actinacidiphila acididurans TaxID=2784346 RepID=A0ABS2TWL4_9ACTN|nr:thioredoxin domain-containing protein [Actinacidiphila acididurans]MBM9507361.1 thioredoxin domain-containing protein [Actinacidiphila acididurans]
MTESKGPGGAAGPKKRKGPLQRLKPYAVGITAMVVVFGGSALIGAHVRSTKGDKVTEPSGVAGAAVVPTGPVSTSSASPTPTPTDQQHLSVPVRPAIPVTITVFEDLRSPDSKAFDEEYNAMFAQLLLTGQVQIHYRLVTASDAQYGGKGALVAANAAACAQDQSRFVQFVEQVWKHQPDPSSDGLASENLMKKLAKKAGKINMGKFDPCVEQSDHEGWVRQGQKDFAAQKLGSVPVVQINDTTVSNVRTTLTPKKLRALILKEAKRVIAVQATPSASPSPMAG